MDSNKNIEAAEIVAEKGIEGVRIDIAQANAALVHAHALIAIAKELRAIREIMEGVTDADGKLDLCKLIKIV